MGYFGGIFLLLICYVGFIAPEVGWFGVTGAGGLDIRAVAVFSARLVRRLRAAGVPGRARGAAGPGPAPGRLLRLLPVAVARHPQPLAPRPQRGLLPDRVRPLPRRAGRASSASAPSWPSASTGWPSPPCWSSAWWPTWSPRSARSSLGRVEDRVGPKRIIMVSLIGLVVSCVVLLFAQGTTLFWVFGLALCLWVGPAQASSRSFLARVAPPAARARCSACTPPPAGRPRSWPRDFSPSSRHCSQIGSVSWASRSCWRRVRWRSPAWIRRRLQPGDGRQRERPPGT